MADFCAGSRFFEIGKDLRFGRCRFRRMTIEDSGLLHAWRKDGDIGRHFASNKPFTAAGHRAWMTEALADPNKECFIVMLDERPVGHAKLYNIDREERRGEGGFYLSNSPYRGFGIGAIVEFILLCYVFENLKFRRTACQIVETNRIVLRLQRRFGFVEEGRLRSYLERDGKALDLILFSMLDTEWRQHRQSILDTIDAASLWTCRSNPTENGAIAAQ